MNNTSMDMDEPVDDGAVPNESVSAAPVNAAAAVNDDDDEAINEDVQLAEVRVVWGECAQSHHRTQLLEDLSLGPDGEDGGNGDGDGDDDDDDDDDDNNEYE
jgi:hypothetical protein